MTNFPESIWGASRVTFVPASAKDFFGAPATHAVMFALEGGAYLLASIPARGWCVPSGKIEPGETPVDAALRETIEEAGAKVTSPVLLGEFRFYGQSGEARHAAVAFVARVLERRSIPAGSESVACRTASLDEVPALYYIWDDLLAAVFAFAEETARSAGLVIPRPACGERVRG